MSYYILVPRFLTPESTIKLVSELYSCSGLPSYTFDFKNVYSVEPFSIAFLSYSISAFQNYNNNCEILCANFSHMDYAGHMGFFKAFGLDYGKFPGEATGSSTYIPLTIQKTSDFWHDIYVTNSTVGDFFTSLSKKMSAILCRNNEGAFFDTLSYCMRELLRNILEHSQAEKLGFCAQYWPTSQKVSLCIMDNGTGVRHSLSKNPFLNLSDDLEAILASLQPGISGKVYKGKKTDPNDGWVNSGYGLYMISNISKMAGTFLMMSGKKCVYISDKRNDIYDCNIDGTLINITFYTYKLKDLAETLKTLGSVKPQQKPSASSLKL